MLADAPYIARLTCRFFYVCHTPCLALLLRYASAAIACRSAMLHRLPRAFSYAIFSLLRRFAFIAAHFPDALFMFRYFIVATDFIDYYSVYADILLHRPLIAMSFRRFFFSMMFRHIDYFADIFR